MTDFKNSFLGGFDYDEIGLITGTSAYRQFPNLPGQLFRLQGNSANAGSFLIGTFTGTKTGFAVGAQLAWEIDAAYDTGWFKVQGDNLNSLYFLNASGGGEKLTYWIQR